MIPFYGKSKPSEFLQAMVDGMRNLYPNQEINMATFGEVVGKVCYGCAATWALQNLAGRQLTTDEVAVRGRNDKGPIEGESSRAILKFDRAMNLARAGVMWDFALFCELPADALARWEGLWNLSKLPDKAGFDTIDRAIVEMQEVGL